MRSIKLCSAARGSLAAGTRDLTSNTMADLPIDDLNVASNETLITPEQLKREMPLRETALQIAHKIASKSPDMIRIAKEALNGIEDGNLEDKYRWEQGFTLQAYTSADSAETRRAFVEKRDATF